MTKPILYVQPFTIFDRRVLAYIYVKGIRDKLEIIHVGPEQVSPERRPGQTPFLQISRGKKEDISDSSAIIEYLEDIFPQEPILRGKDPYTTSKTRSLIYAMETAVHSYFIYLISASHITTLMGRKPNPDAARQGLIYGHKYLGVLESEVASNGPLLTESQEVTIADIMLAVTFHYCWYCYGSPIWETHPRLEKIWDAVKDWPCLDHENWMKLRTEDVWNLSRQLDIRWSDLTEEEKKWSVM